MLYFSRKLLVLPRPGSVEKSCMWIINQHCLFRIKQCWKPVTFFFGVSLLNWTDEKECFPVCLIILVIVKNYNWQRIKFPTPEVKLNGNLKQGKFFYANDKKKRNFLASCCLNYSLPERCLVKKRNKSRVAVCALNRCLFWRRRLVAYLIYEVRKRKKPHSLVSLMFGSNWTFCGTDAFWQLSHLRMSPILLMNQLPPRDRDFLHVYLKFLADLFRIEPNKTREIW